LVDILSLFLSISLLISIFNICFFQVLLCDSISEVNGADNSVIQNTDLSNDRAIDNEVSPGFFLKYKLIFKRKLY
jgi:hypothetical protein